MSNNHSLYSMLQPVRNGKMEATNSPSLNGNSCQ